MSTPVRYLVKVREVTPDLLAVFELLEEAGAQVYQFGRVLSHPAVQHAVKQNEARPVPPQGLNGNDVVRAAALTQIGTFNSTDIARVTGYPGGKCSHVCTQLLKEGRLVDLTPEKHKYKRYRVS